MASVTSTLGGLLGQVDAWAREAVADSLETVVAGVLVVGLVLGTLLASMVLVVQVGGVCWAHCKSLCSINDLYCLASWLCCTAQS